MSFKVVKTNINELIVDAVIDPNNIDYKETLFFGEAREETCTNGKSKYIIHTKVGSRIGLIAKSYRNSVSLATSLGCKSIAIPLLSTKPKTERSFSLAVSILQDAAKKNPDLDIYLSLNTTWADKLPDSLFEKISENLQSSYVPTLYFGNKIGTAYPPEDDKPKDDTPKDWDPNSYQKTAYASIHEDKEVIPSDHKESSNLDRSYISVGRWDELRKVIGNRAKSSASDTGNYTIPEVLRYSKDEDKPKESAQSAPELEKDSLAKQIEAIEKSNPKYQTEENSCIESRDYGELIRQLLEKPTQVNLEKIPVDENFGQMLARLIKERDYKKNTIRDEIDISEPGFWKLLTGKSNPTKLTVFGIAIALKLEIEETREMLMKAGYAINQSSLQDIVLAGLIENKIYDRNTIDELLYSLDLQLLPGSVIDD